MTLCKKNIAFVAIMLFLSTVAATYAAYRPGMRFGFTGDYAISSSITLATVMPWPSETNAVLYTELADYSISRMPADHRSAVYWGEIYLDGPITFGQHVNQGFMIKIGNFLGVNASWYNAKYWTYTPPAAGWYPFELRVSSSVKGGSIADAYAYWNRSDLCFGYTPRVLASYGGNSYNLISDSGDGSFLRFDDGTGADHSVYVESTSGQQIGTASPAYGVFNNDYENGENIEFSLSVPADTIDTHYSYSGYKVWQGETVISEGDESAFTLAHPGSLIRVVWDVSATYKISASAMPGGSVSAAETWLAADESVTLAATSDDGFEFAYWAGDVPDSANLTSETLTLSYDRARVVKAVFRPVGSASTIYVATNGNDRADGVLPTSALADPNFAFRMCHNGDTVVMLAGEYFFDATIKLVGKSRVTLRAADNADVSVTGRGYFSDKLIWVSDGSNTVRDITFKNSQLQMAYFDKTAFASNCVFKEGSVKYPYAASGIVSVNTSSRLRDCAIINNTNNSSGGASAFGIGLGVSGGECLIENCVITNNINTSGRPSKGTVYIASTATGKKHSFVNCLIADNLVYESGAVAFCNNASAYFENCTLANNRTLTENNQAAFAFSGSKPLLITNCIVKGNTCLSGMEYNNIVGSSIFVGNTATDFDCQGNGNVIVQSCFKDAEAGNYRLSASACVDGGINTSSALAEGAVDLDGAKRIQGGTVDMGCYESLGADFDVSVSSSTASQSFLTNVAVTLTAHVSGAGNAAVSYVWTVTNESDFVYSRSGTGADFSHTKELDLGVGCYGYELTVSIPGKTKTVGGSGFVTVFPHEVFVAPNGASAAPYITPANAHTSIVELARVAVDGMVITVMPGTYSESGTVFLNKNITVRGYDRDTVVIRDNATKTDVFSLSVSNAIVERLTISNSLARAMTIKGKSLVRDITVRDNHLKATIDDGAVAKISDDSVFRDSLVYNCASPSSGGAQDQGMFLLQNGLLENVAIIGCAGGGGMHALIYKTGFGVTIKSGGVMRNCQISGCKSLGSITRGNPVVYCYDGVIENCTICDNACIGGEFTKGAIVLDGSSKLVNTVLWNNTKIPGLNDQYPFAEIVSIDGASVFTNCLVQTEDASVVIGSDNILNEDPLLLLSADGIFVPSSISRCVNGGIIRDWMYALDADGNPLDGQDGRELVYVNDIIGRPRVIMRRPDIGCAESAVQPKTIIVVR